MSQQSFALLQAITSATSYPKFRFYCFPAVAFLIGGLWLFYTDDPTKALPASPVSTRALTVHASASLVAQDSAPDAVIPVDLYKYALNAFLVPLLDDSAPPKWTDIAMYFACEPESQVMVDGKPMVSGNPIPVKSFTVSWNMDRCAPFGRESVELTGTVELVVVRNATGLSATVTPVALRVDSFNGRSRLRGPFKAEMAMDMLAPMPQLNTANP